MSFNQYFFFNELHTKRQFAGKRNITYELNLGLVSTYMFWYEYNKMGRKSTSKYAHTPKHNKVLTSDYIISGQHNLHLVYFVECH